jgi:hypothetical protein
MTMLALDHLILLSRDVDADAQRVSELGFHTEPKGRHPALGTCNRLIMLDTTYFELLGVEGSTERTAYYEQCLEQPGDHVGIVLRGDAQAAYDDFRARGYAASPPLAFGRPVETAEGTKDARFLLVRLDVAHTPGAFLCVCEHQTPDLVWRKPLPRHDNGATNLAKLIWTAPEPRSMATAFADALGMELGGTTERPILRFPNASFEFSRSADDPGDGGGEQARRERLSAIEFEGRGPGLGPKPWPGTSISWRVRPEE